MTRATKGDGCLLFVVPHDARRPAKTLVSAALFENTRSTATVGVQLSTQLQFFL
jgi:hypothetical protein